MAKAPSPITSPPPQPWQPYDATAPGRPEDQVAPGTIYDASGGSGSEPWPKIQDGGAAGPDGVAQAGAWPGNGDSSAGPWKQT